MLWPILKQSPFIAFGGCLCRSSVRSSERGGQPGPKGNVVAAKRNRLWSHLIRFQHNAHPSPPAPLPPAPRWFPSWLRKLWRRAMLRVSVFSSVKWGKLCELGDSARGARWVAETSVLRSHTSSTPPSRGPHPGAPGLQARLWLLSASRVPAALHRRPGRGWHGASAGQARGAEPSPGRGPGRGRR